eukprot:834171-Pelagomonas_calceolata.AAC.1
MQGRGCQGVDQGSGCALTAVWARTLMSHTQPAQVKHEDVLDEPGMRHLEIIFAPHTRHDMCRSSIAHHKGQAFQAKLAGQVMYITGQGYAGQASESRQEVSGTGQRMFCGIRHLTPVGVGVQVWRGE